MGQTPLHKAAQGGNDKNIKKLISAGSNIECQDSKGRRPLHFAAVEGNQKSVGRLLNHGADINAQDNKGSTPLHFAANLSLKSSVILELIASGVDLDLRDNFGRTPLHLAASTKRASILKALFESGLEVDLIDNKGKTSLHYVAIHGSERAIIMLLAFGAWFKPKDIDGNTPKLYAQTNKELKKHRNFRNALKIIFNIPMT